MGALLDTLQPNQPPNQSTLQPAPREDLDLGVGGTIAAAVGGLGRRFVTTQQNIVPEFTELQALTSSLRGNEADAARLMEIAQKERADIEQRRPRRVPTFEQALTGGLDDFTVWAAETTGEAVGFVAQTLLSGGFGSIAGRLAAKGVSSASLKALAKKHAFKAGALGRTTSAGATEVTGRIYEATGEVRPDVALPAGVVIGAMDAVLPLFFRERFGFGDQLTKSFIGKLSDNLARAGLGRAGAALGGALGEGATEVLQEAVSAAAQDFVDENFDILSEEQLSNFLNAAAAGAIGGGILSAAVSQLAPPPDVPAGTDQLRNVAEETLAVLPAGGGTEAEGEAVPAPPGEPQSPIIHAPPEGVLVEPPDGIAVGPVTTPEIFLEDPEDSFYAIGESAYTLETPAGAVQAQRLNTGPAAQRQLAQEPGGTPRLASIALVEQAGLTGRDVTVAPEDLPLSRDSTRVTAPTPGAALKLSEAMRAMQEVRRLEAADEDASAAQQEVSAAYAEAIALGARVRPRKGDSVLVLGKPVQGRPVETVAVERATMDTFRPELTAVGASSDGRVLHQDRVGYARVARREDLRVESTDDERRRPVWAPRDRETAQQHYTVRELPLRFLTNPEGFLVDVPFIDTRGKGDPERLQERIYEALRDGDSAEAMALYRRFTAAGFRVDLDYALDNDLELEPTFREIPPGFLQVPSIGQFQRTRIEGNFVLAIPGDSFIIPPELKLATTGVSYTNLSGQPAKGAAKAARILKKAHRALGISTPLTVVVADYRIEKGKIHVTGEVGPSTWKGAALHLGQHGGFIWLKPGLSEAEALLVVAHEFGHFIQDDILARAPVEVKDAILRDYDRHLLAVSRTVTTEGAISTASAFRAGVLDRLQPLAEDRADADYFYGLDEWIAEQVVKWLQTRAQPLSRIDKVFKQIADALQRAFDMFRKLHPEIKRFDLRAAPAVEAYLDSWAEQIDPNYGRRNLPPTAAVLHAQAMADSQLKNAQLLDVPLKIAPPSVAGSYGPKLIVSHMVGPKEGEEAGATSAWWHWRSAQGYNIFQIERKQKGAVPGLTRYTQLLQVWQLERNKWVARVEAGLKRFKQLSLVQRRAVERFLFALDGLDAWPSVEDYVKLAESHGLDNRGIIVVREMIKDFQEALDNQEEILRNEARETLEGEALQKRLNRIAQEYTALRSRPYFPHMRFGREAVVIRSKETGKTVFFRAFANSEDADLAARELQAEYPAAEFGIRRDILSQDSAPLTMLSQSMLEAMAAKLKLDDAQVRALELMVHGGRQAAAIKRIPNMRPREDVEGWSTDIERAYTAYFAIGSNHWARIKYGAQMRETVGMIEKQISDHMGSIDDVRNLRRIRDHVDQHITATLYPAKDWSGWWRGLAFSWHLGFSVASAAVNATQVPMVSWPFLSKVFEKIPGVTDAFVASTLARMYGKTLQAYRNPGKLRADELRALGFWRDTGKLTESRFIDLAGLSDGGIVDAALAGNQLQRMWKMGSYWAGWMFANVEHTNRHVTAFAAYELAMKNPDTPYLRDLQQRDQLMFEEILKRGASEQEARAILMGIDAMDQTQFEYAEHARPNILRGPNRAALLLFYSYVLNMLNFARNSPGRGRWLLLMPLMAGAMGLPGAEDMDDIIAWVARRLGMNFRPSLEARKAIMELGANPDLVLHGVSSKSFGLTQAFNSVGLPFPELDVSRQLGLGSIIPGIEFLSEGDAQRKTLAGVQGMAGAVGAIPINIILAAQDDHPDWQRRWERAMPRAFRGLSKAQRVAERDMETDRREAKVVGFDPSDPQESAEVVALAMGFQPSRLRKAWDERAFKHEAGSYWGTRRGRLLSTLNHAVAIGDDKLRAQAIKDIRLFDNEVPDRTLVITGDTIKRSIRQAVKLRRRAELGIPPTRLGTQLWREVDELYEEPVR